MNKKSIKLCCGGRGCPELTIEGNKVKITDDYGKSVLMEISEAKLINGALNRALAMNATKVKE